MSTVVLLNNQIVYDSINLPRQPVTASIILIGYGAIGQALTPLLLKHFDIEPARVTVISPCEAEAAIAIQYGLKFISAGITPNNLDVLLLPLLKQGDWLINVSVNVSSLDLIHCCQARGALYLDTCIEPWPGQYGSPKNPGGLTNYALREKALSLHRPGAPTAIVAHGANPGLVTHFAKAGLVRLAAMKNIVSWSSWADLAFQLDIRVIQVAERDAQRTAGYPFESGCFYNTWSVDGFLAEAFQYAELGWGTHEISLPSHGYPHSFGERSGIYLDRHGAHVQVRSWVPSVGEQVAYLITHHEALSIASLLTVFSENGRPRYRPTVYYAYRPSSITCQSINSWINCGLADPLSKIVLKDELIDGFDQLGVLLIFPGGAYWYGSTLALEDARTIAPDNNATTMQVAAGVIGAIEWMRNHPHEGIVEAESMDFNQVLAVATPYLGEVSGVLTNWQPSDKGELKWKDFEIIPYLACI